MLIDVLVKGFGSQNQRVRYWYDMYRYRRSGTVTAPHTVRRFREWSTERVYTSQQWAILHREVLSRRLVSFDIPSVLARAGWLTHSAVRDIIHMSAA